MAQAGLARAIRPAHSPVDGDTIFALATGRNADADGPASAGDAGGAGGGAGDRAGGDDGDGLAGVPSAGEWMAER